MSALGGPEALGGARLVNLLGSHGLKAAACALLGAAQPVTVVDVSPGNAQYAREVAAAAGVEIRRGPCAGVPGLPLAE